MKHEIILGNFFMGISFLATNWLSRITLMLCGLIWLYAAYKKLQLDKKEFGDKFKWDRESKN